MVTSKQSLGPLSHLPVSWVISSAYNIVVPFANSAFHRIGAAGKGIEFLGSSQDCVIWSLTAMTAEASTC